MTSEPTMGGVRDAATALAAPSDEEMVERVLGGDAVAFELLMRRHNQRLFRLVRALVGDADEAEDVVQDAYVRAFQHVDRFEGRASLATWLSRIALHEALRRRRRRRVAQRRLVDVAKEQEALVAGRRVAGSSSQQLETRALLTAALDALPDGLRVVAMLRLVQGLTTRETAASLRMTEANVKVSLHRARAMLAESVQRTLVTGLGDLHRFDGERCDRIVAGVLRRLGASDVGPQPATI